MLLKKHNPNDPQWRGEEAMPCCRFGKAKKLHLANIRCFCRLLARLGKNSTNKISIKCKDSYKIME